MVQAYILIQTDVGKSGIVADAVRAIDGVAQVDEVTGPYDIIARIQAETVEALGKLVIARIQDVNAISRTLTCAVVHG